MNQSLCRRDPRVIASWIMGLALLAALAAPAWGQDAYSYFRTVEGYADLETATDGEVLAAEENQPLVPGDALRVDSGSRVEAVLSDGTLLRIDERTDVVFESLAWTPDSGDTATRLTLLAGELQAVIGYGRTAGSPLTVETRNATLYLDAPGAYRVAFDGYDATEVIVREGSAEAQTDRGTSIVRAGESGYVSGGEWASVDVAAAGGRDRLESWGDELDAEARLAQVPNIEPELRYRAARMANYGAWIDVGGRSAWRPAVATGWRPYSDGSWVYTPSGLTWVSSEPWGWIPSHYGSWELVPGYGWVWFAGASYSPAWVYWYWGPTHVAWVPSGYYTSYYAGSHGYAPRWGVYGWAGGSWDLFGEWVFCPTRYFGRPHYQTYFRSGREVAQHATYRDLPRGVIATDTRSLRRDVWGQPDAIQTRLTASRTRLSQGEMPDVTDFVARRRDMRPEVAAITRPQPVATRQRTASVAAAPRGVRTARTADERKAATARFDSGWVTRPASPGAAQRDDRGEITVRSRSRFETRDQGDFRVYDRGTYGRPRLEPNTPASGRSVFARPDSEGGASRLDATRRTLPPQSEERPIAQRVIDQVRGRRTTGGEDAAGPAARPTPPPAERGSSDSGRVRSAPAERGERATSSDSRSRADSGKPPARSRTASERKPPQG
jgi:Family of unknown function (DUF6600)/FecR protein